MPCHGGGWTPWSCAGAPDPDFDETARQTHRTLLTDDRLLLCFRRRFPEHEEADYDEMVRCLGWVWDCAHDHAANVTGYCCASCGRTRAAAADAIRMYYS
jgi:hypothetical protein